MPHNPSVLWQPAGLDLSGSRADAASSAPLSSPASSGPAPLPPWSGALHYFRTSPARWRTALQGLFDLGFRLVESYVPWGVHEIARGSYRFAGSYDLGRFLDQAAEVGLKVILRPGPHINAELPFFGFPERIVHDPRLCMRNAFGQPLLVPLPPRMFPAPSYAAAGLYEETARWYAAVGQIVAPRLHPAGPVVALQVDNEQPSFFRTAAYDGDYHEEARAAFADYLRVQHPHQANQDNSQPPREFPAVVKDPAELLPHLRWLAFKEAQVPQALSRLGGLLDQAGLGGVPRFANFPPADPIPFDVARAESLLSCAGIDMYHRRAEYQTVRRRSLYLLGSSRFPYVPEMGAGSFPWGPPLVDEDSQATLLNALGHGVRGFNLYMAVERDRWYGAPLDENGHPRGERAAFYRRLLTGLREADAAALRADAAIGVLCPREYQRLTLCASHLGPMSPMWLTWFGWDPEMAARRETLGLSSAVQQDFPRRREALLSALDQEHRRYALVDASCASEHLQRYRVLIVPTYDFLDRGLAARLRHFVTAGGVLIIGPRVPDRDEDLAPCDHDLRHGRVHLVPDGDLRVALRAALPDADPADSAFRPEPGDPAQAAGCDVMTHSDSAGEVRLVALGNHHKAPATARLPTPGPTTLRDLISGETFSGAAGLTVPLGPYAVRLLAKE